MYEILRLKLNLLMLATEERQVQKCTRIIWMYVAALVEHRVALCIGCVHPSLEQYMLALLAFLE